MSAGSGPRRLLDRRIGRAGYEVDSASSHCLVAGTRRIERRNTHHMKPDNAAAARVIAAIAQCRTASDDTAPIRAQSPRAPLGGLRPAVARRPGPDRLHLPGSPPSTRRTGRTRHRAARTSRQLGDGADLLEATRENQLEGIVAKRIDSLYRAGARSPMWRKVKIRPRLEFVVGGWHPGERGRAGQLGSLLLGYYLDAARPYAGKVGTGVQGP
jgi:hypothetical protein